MSQDHETPRSSKDGDQHDLSITLSYKTYEKKYNLYDVKKDLHTWKKENTCQSCLITFENFHVRLNHKCMPHRCEVCGSAFEQDYMLKMHKPVCNSDRSSSRKPHVCTACNTSFSEKNALSKHQNSCSNKKMCVNCGKQLPIKTLCDFCRKCRFLLEKDQKYSLRCNSSSKLEVAKTGIKENGNGLHPSTNDKEINGDEKSDKPNHVDDYPSPDFNKLRRKRRSLDGIAENSNPKKTFESNAADSLSNSDTSLDQLDDRCNFKNRKRQKELERIGDKLKKSLVTVLGNPSEKKRSDQSPVSKKAPERTPKASIVNASCNGVKDLKHKAGEGYDSDSDVFSLGKSFNLLSSTSLKRSLKEADLDASPESCVRKTCKETVILKESSSNACSLEKVDQALAQPLRKSKRNLNNRKASLNRPSIEEKNESEACQTISVESSGPVTASTKNNIEFVAKNDTKESVESSSVINSNSDEKTTSKLFVGNSKEVVAKKSLRLNPVTKLPSSSQRISPELKDPINTSESAQSYIRKSKRQMKRDESTKKSESSENYDMLKRTDKSFLTFEKEIYSEPVSHRSGGNSKHKKESETAKDGCSWQGNLVATDSDAVSAVSTSSVKGKRISHRKKYDDGHEDKGRSSAKSPVPASKINRLSNKSNEKNEVEKSTATKAVKSKVESCEKTQKETIQPRKLTPKNTSANTPESPTLATRRGSFGSNKQNGNGAKPNSRNKINAMRASPSSIDYTPELEVSESTLNSVPDISFTPHRLLGGGYLEGESDKIFAKIGRVSNSENDTIKLESLLNVLPDSDSGVLLRVLSNTSDNYRCLKCNKLFKTIKMASTHYADCKTTRIKKTTSLLLKDIIWICVQCNYHCYQMSELNFHRQSCSKSSNSVSIDNCIRNYTDTCLKYCSKCSFSCISSITFKKHPCEQRLEQMSKCVIDVEKLSEKNFSVQKYECTYCESTFLNLKAYKRHIAKHTVSADDRPQVIKQEPVETSEDVLKSLLEPLCSAKLSTLNLLGTKQRSSLPAEAAFEEEDDSRKNRMEIGKILSFLQKEGEGSLPADLPDSEIQIPDKLWRTYQRDYGCRCKKHQNAVEEKPCLACLNTYIKSKGGVSCQTDSSTQTDPPLLEDATGFPPTSLSDIPTLTIANVSVADMSLDSSADGMNMSSLEQPIHITSVSSCTNPELSVSSPLVDSASITNISSYPLLRLMQNDFISGLPANLDDDKFSPQVSSSNSSKSELYISLILILKGNFVDSKYTIEKHNDLVKSIYKLKFKKLAEPHVVHPDQYYLLTEYIHRPEDESNNDLSECMNQTFNLGCSKLSYDESVLQNYFLIDKPFTELMPLFVSQEPCDFDVVLCDSVRHFIHLSWQFAPDICYSAYCVKSDSEPTGIKFICGLCFDYISIHLLIEHFDKVHEGAYHYNILIS